MCQTQGTGMDEGGGSDRCPFPAAGLPGPCQLQAVSLSAACTVWICSWDSLLLVLKWWPGVWGTVNSCGWDGVLGIPTPTAQHRPCTAGVDSGLPPA